VKRLGLPLVLIEGAEFQVKALQKERADGAGGGIRSGYATGAMNFVNHMR